MCMCVEYYYYYTLHFRHTLYDGTIIDSKQTTNQLL